MREREKKKSSLRESAGSLIHALPTHQRGSTVSGKKDPSLQATDIVAMSYQISKWGAKVGGQGCHVVGQSTPETGLGCSFIDLESRVPGSSRTLFCVLAKCQNLVAS